MKLKNEKMENIIRIFFELIASAATGLIVSVYMTLQYHISFSVAYLIFLIVMFEMISILNRLQLIDIQNKSNMK